MSDWVVAGTTAKTNDWIYRLQMRIIGANADVFSVRYAVRFRDPATFYGRDGDIVSVPTAPIKGLYVSVLKI
jgi:hypothetical protein